MTADEIAKYPVGYPISSDEMLREIAIQLAELKPRWVWLPIGDGVNGVFDVSKIRLLRPGSKPHITVVGNDWRDEQMIFAPIAEVCVKLGIPVEGE